MAHAHVLLVDPEGTVLAKRLRMQGYAVHEAVDGEDGARQALQNPPSAIVADLWSRGISGVQLCRLLRAEPATAHVPVLLRGPTGHRERFWARRAGAAAYVPKGRVGDLVRELGEAIAATPQTDGFFTDLGHSIDLRDRVAAYLDQALFESVVASDIRALGACGNFERLFDLLSQFLVQVADYRWLALVTDGPHRFALHTQSSTRSRSEGEARTALGLGDRPLTVLVEDDDAHPEEDGPAPLSVPVELGGTRLGSIALAPRSAGSDESRILGVVARELAGPLRVVSLLEESLRLATVDPLTGLSNRRAFVQALAQEVARAHRHQRALSVALLDVDHFKRINDTHGHGAGDAVLAAMGRLFTSVTREGDFAARWGGEEFVVALHDCDANGAMVAAERLRAAIAALCVDVPSLTLHVTASIGVAELRPGEALEALVDRADRAMYTAKSGGRNQVAASPEETAIAAE